MPILLPSSPQPASAVPELLSWGGVLTPPLGGASIRLNRLGDRYRLSVTLPSRLTGEILRVYLARLRQALTQGAIMPFPQPDIVVGNPGIPRVSGGNQSGSTLVIGGFVSGYVIREGQFFSILTGGRRYLHCAAAQVTAGTNNIAAVPVTPMLRVRPADSAMCEFSEPKIEGFLSGDSVAWTFTRAKTTPPQFVITEVE